MELFGLRDEISSMIGQSVCNSSELEKSRIRANTKISGLLESSNHQPIPTHEVTQERNVSRTQKYDMGCKCGLGTMGEVKKDESMIIKGYVPEKRPWMVYIKVNFQNLSKTHNWDLR